MQYFAGVDIGSTMTKVVIMDDSVLASVIGPTGPEHRKLANRVMEEALKKAKLSFDAITYLVATGYGRINVPFADRQITEISCHARGIAYLFPEARTVIDIGGQDSKGIKIKDGRAVDFVMNDKCAAGSGRFLEVAAEELGVELEDLGKLALESKNAVRISNICTVFATQEVVGKLSDGAALPDIIAGLHESIATRVYGMLRRLKIEREVVMTGGGAKNIGLVRALEAKLGFPVLVPAEPLLTGAIGAAMLGRDIVKEAEKKGTKLDRAERRLTEATLFT
ncbi:MAG: acyl-CoA dehydratase activase [Dehalococcoidia bacterium]|jgi:predicted CoA-substrate-specific enzyme activase